MTANYSQTCVIVSIPCLPVPTKQDSINSIQYEAINKFLTKTGAKTAPH